MNDLVVRTLIQYYWTLLRAAQEAGHRYCDTERKERYWSRRESRLVKELKSFGPNFQAAMTAEAASAYRERGVIDEFANEEV